MNSSSDGVFHAVNTSVSRSRRNNSSSSRDGDVVVDDSTDSVPNRSRSPGTTQRKRRQSIVSADPLPQPKRPKSAAFNPRYLQLLNKEIEDAAGGVVFSEEDRHRFSAIPWPALEQTQVGVVFWTPLEKEAFFSALARLGRDDIARIAAQIPRGTKSELEVRQYIMLLEASERRRREKREGKWPMSLRPVDIPAAIEVSAACCLALDDAADAVAQRQERYEAGREQTRWRDRWLVTPELAFTLDRQYKRQTQAQKPQERGRSRKRRRDDDSGSGSDHHVDPNVLPYVNLFRIRTWLKLSDRIFMNSTIPDGNWRTLVSEIGAVDESARSVEGPSMRATAFDDFYSLAVSITRRAVSACLYVANSRIRSKRNFDSRRPDRYRSYVKSEDVWAAVASVGLDEGSREFWAKCARRIKLEVYDDDDDDQSVAGSEDRCSFDLPIRVRREDQDGSSTIINADLERRQGSEIARGHDDSGTKSNEDHQKKEDTEEDDSGDRYKILSYDEVESRLGFVPRRTDASYIEIPDSDEVSSTTEFSSTDEEYESDVAMDILTPLPEEVEDDVEEAITFSALAVDYPSRRALRIRIAAEHRLENEADHFDGQTSVREDAQLWKLLRGEINEDDDNSDEYNELRSDQKLKGKAQAVDEGDEEDNVDEDKVDSGMGDEDEDEAGPASRRLPAGLSGLRDLSNWRDTLTYYSEWESRSGQPT